MSRTIVNQLTWSVSRDRLFRECRRAYYYNYYGSWGGWDAAAADERTRKLYVLKNLQSLQMWAGGIVHEVIAEALQRHAAKRTLIEKSRLFDRARHKMREGWLDAVNRKWQAAPKKTNLSELYYGNGTELPREQTDKVQQRVYDCLESFAVSSLLEEAISASYMNWKPIDTLDSFLLRDETKVWCAVDFAFFDRQGGLRILDWKTGGEYSDELQLQLSCYALYGMDKWQIPLDRLRLAGVFLNDQARVSEYQISEDELSRTRATIYSSIQEMRSFLQEPEKNRAQEKDFPPCEDQRICSRCNFREVCPAFPGAAE